MIQQEVLGLHKIAGAILQTHLQQLFFKVILKLSNHFLLVLTVISVFLFAAFTK